MWSVAWTGGGHADEAVALEELGVEDADAVEAGVLALLDEGGNFRSRATGRHSQVNLYGHILLLIEVAIAGFTPTRRGREQTTD